MPESRIPTMPRTERTQPRTDPAPASVAFEWQPIKPRGWMPAEPREALDAWNVAAAAVTDDWRELRAAAAALPLAVTADPEATLRQAAKLAKDARALCVRELQLVDARATLAGTVQTAATEHKRAVMAAYAERRTKLETELLQLEKPQLISPAIAQDAELGRLLGNAEGLSRLGETLCGLNDRESGRVADVGKWLVAQIGLALP